MLHLNLPLVVERCLLFHLSLSFSQKQLLLDPSLLIFKFPLLRGQSVLLLLFLLSLVDLVPQLAGAVFLLSETHEFHDSLGRFLLHVGNGLVLETGVVVVLGLFGSLLEFGLKAVEVDLALLFLVLKSDVKGLFKLFQVINSLISSRII